MENSKDQRLWRLAEKRAAFKRNLVAYVVVNIFLIGVWYLSGGKDGRSFWPIWPILGWGLGVVLNYFAAYHTNSGLSVEKEYENLKKENP